MCHACAIAIRAEIRRGLLALEEYLDGTLKLERWLESDWLVNED